MTSDIERMDLLQQNSQEEQKTSQLLIEEGHYQSSKKKPNILFAKEESLLSEDGSFDSLFEGKPQDSIEVTCNKTAEEGEDCVDNGQNVVSTDCVTKKSENSWSAVGDELVVSLDAASVDVDHSACLYKMTEGLESAVCCKRNITSDAEATSAVQFDSRDSNCMADISQLDERHLPSGDLSPFLRHANEKYRSEVDNECHIVHRDGTVTSDTLVSTAKSAKMQAKNSLKSVKELKSKDTVPKLSRGNGEFIILDSISTQQGESASKPVPAGVKKLMDRLLQQNTRKSVAASQNVEIRYVCFDP